VLGQWDGVSQGSFPLGEGGRQRGGVISGMVAQDPSGEFWGVRVLELGLSSEGRTEQDWQVPEEQPRCGWHGFLLLQDAPRWPGCEALFTWHMLFLHSSEGEQSSAAVQRWPLQPKVHGLVEGM
jgi:hypothetical protein